MKVLVGTNGLTEESPALNRFCLAPPLLRNLSQEFLLPNSIVRSNHSYHYQLAGSKNDRIHINKSTITTLLDSFSIGLAPSQNVTI